jgi:hypothetical protein
MATAKSKALKMYDNKIRNELKREKQASKVSNKEAQPKLREYMANQAKKRAEGFYNKK